MTKKILVIDNNKILLDMIEDLLETQGFQCIKAASGEEGMDYAKSKHPHAILLNQKMPGLSGNEILKHLRNDAETANIPVLILTDENKVADVARALELGARDYIVKPFDNENLIIRLKNVLHGQ